MCQNWICCVGRSAFIVPLLQHFPHFRHWPQVLQCFCACDSGYFSCTNKHALAPVWKPWFCPYDCIYFASVTATVPVWLHYLYCYSAVTRSYQPEWPVIQNMLESRDNCTRPDNNSELFQNQVEIWPLLCGVWSLFPLSYHCLIVLTCNDWGAYSSSEYAHMALKIFFKNLHSSMLFRIIYCR
jgi:hypothetical protein